MRAVISNLLLFTIILCHVSCGKSGGGGNTEPPEQNLSISINPDPSGSVAPALSGTYAFKLIINSTPPKNGVKIDITATKESDNSVQFSQTSQTTNNATTNVDLSLQNLVLGLLYVIKVDVTSLTTPTNKASLTFKVARK
jgi:hypothetical protein